MATATFGAGCFWGIEDALAKVPGVTATRVGFTAGTTDSPSYEEVCSGRTGHVEAVQVEFDPGKVSYDGLLDVFWQIHDPTTLNRQGPDRGTQYRSGIYVHSPEQAAAAKASLAEADRSGRFPNKIVTEIVATDSFFEAEAYHQKYFQKMGQAHQF